MDPLNADAWLNLGVPGAALFIIAIVIILLFRQQSKSIDKLCTKLDDIVSSFAVNNLKLNEVIICNDKDQRQILIELGRMNAALQDIQRRLIKEDAQRGGQHYESKNIHEAPRPDNR